MIVLIKWIVFLVQRPLIFMSHWYGHQTFKLFDFNEDFRKFISQTSYQFWFQKDCVTSFSCSFFCLQITAEISKIKKRTQRDLYFTFKWCSFKIFQYFGEKTLPVRYIKRCLQKNCSGFWKGLSGYHMVFKNKIVALAFTRKIF